MVPNSKSASHSQTWTFFQGQSPKARQFKYPIRDRPDRRDRGRFAARREEVTRACRTSPACRAASRRRSGPAEPSRGGVKMETI